VKENRGNSQHNWSLKWEGNGTPAAILVTWLVLNQ